MLAAALTLGPGALLLSRLQGLGPIGKLIGQAAMATSSVAQVFAFPIVATTDGDPTDAFDELTDALESEWGAAMVSVLSTRALMTAIGWSGIVTGVPLLFLAFSGISFVSLPPWGPFTVPVLLPLASLWLAFAVTAFVRSVLYTALYRYARTGEFHGEIGTSPDAMLGDGAGNRTPAHHGD